MTSLSDNGETFSENLTCRLEFDAAELVASHPPVFHHPHKRLLYSLACPAECRHEGRIEFTRWQAASLPEFFTSARSEPLLEVRNTIFQYEPVPDESDRDEWYVNFAHHDLFCSHGLGVFAQDEIQVAEHPALASLREALLHSPTRPLTVENGVPTPALILGVQRRCAVATDHNDEAGRPQGLYGRQFALASANAISRAMKLIDPPTVSNLIAMEAPSHGRGTYTAEQVEYILETAYTGFSAAIQESRRNDKPSVAVHTGFWGCGAYGGNRTVMATLQILAARLSGLNRLVFHLVDRQGRKDWEAAMRLEGEIRSSSAQSGVLSRMLRWVSLSDGNRSGATSRVDPQRIAHVFAARGLKWGVSDGN